MRSQRAAERAGAVQEDVVDEAVSRLASALPAREDARVLTDLLAEELREGLAALAEVQGHLSGLLDTLRTGRLSPILLLAAAEDTAALVQAEHLCDLLPQLRRRLTRAAVQLQRSGASR